MPSLWREIQLPQQNIIPKKMDGFYKKVGVTNTHYEIKDKIIHKPLKKPFRKQNGLKYFLGTTLLITGLITSHYVQKEPRTKQEHPLLNQEIIKKDSLDQKIRFEELEERNQEIIRRDGLDTQIFTPVIKK